MAKHTVAGAKRCLVIGAGGFLGSSLRRDLKSDHALELVAFDSNGIDLRKPLQVKEALASINPDIIINVGGISSPASDDVFNLYQVNAFGHLHLLQAASVLERKPKVILASSAQLYGPDLVTKAEEQAALNPVSHYGLSKMLAEKYCELFADGVQTVTARIYNAIGRGQSSNFLLPKVVAAFKRRAPTLEVGSLNVERDYVDTRDLTAMWRLVALSDKSPTVVNFSNGEAVSLQHILFRLEEITGHHLELLSKSSNFRKNDIPYQCGDNSAIRNLGYVRRYSLDETLTWMLDE